MFGYIKPFKPELKMREYEHYRAAYCGLCNALRRRYGFLSRFIVNYDFTFVALVLDTAGKYKSEVKKKRCIACPSGRQCIISEVYDKAADISVILSYLKLCDDVSDTGFFKSIFKSRIPRLLMKPAYTRAEKNNSRYAESAKRLYAELSLLETARVPSIDEPADKFAKMLEAFLDEGDENVRILSQMLYHIGRFVYIIDALDDLSEDAKRDEYNPIAERFGVFSGALPEDIHEEVIATLGHSRDAVKLAFDLLDENENTGLIRNIIELGMANSLYLVAKKEK